MSAAAYETLNAHRPALDLAGSGERVGWVDGARGLSIAAMIVSHVGLATGSTPAWFHLVVMRPVAPVFLILLGLLWRPGFRRRHVQLLGGAVVSQLLALYLGFALPNILVVMALVLLVMPLAVRWPQITLGLAVTSIVFWTPAFWSGYPLGFALACAMAGHLLRPDGFVRAYGSFGSRLGLEVVGRWPLTFYLGHLLVLAAATNYGVL